MRRLQIISLIIVGTLAIGGMALANAGPWHQSKSRSSLQSSDTTMASKQFQSKVKAEVTQSQTVNNQSDNCNKTISENNTTSGTNINNSKTTDIQCKAQTQNGTTSVNVTNTNNQSAHSGTSSGQSGTATNTDTTNITVHNQ